MQMPQIRDRAGLPQTLPWLMGQEYLILLRGGPSESPPLVGSTLGSADAGRHCQGREASGES